jgi:pimeloyl-ACP methyl ester carboxylesterase
MLSNKFRRGGIGVLLLVAGFLLSFLSSRGYEERRYIADAGACKLDLLVVEKGGSAVADQKGSVVLFHGIAANKLIMRYLARSFAEQGLRVYIPDLPGHGRSVGPFSPDRAESCSLSLVRGLAARGMIQPERTILAGHSMGAAIALRIADRFRPAGVIAISPAPMSEAHGVQRENLLYLHPPPVSSNTLIMAGQFELNGISASAADLAATSADHSAQYISVPGNTHVSVLFSPTVARASQEWAAKVFQLHFPSHLPSRGNLFGSLLGLLGILLLAGPFIRELLGTESRPEGGSLKYSPIRSILEVATVSALVVLLLHYWQPLRILHLFEGDYLAAFFLLAGLILLLTHVKPGLSQLRTKSSILAGAALAGLLLYLLVTGWFELTATGSWMTLARWTRFPFFFLSTFLFLYTLELFVGSVSSARFSFPFFLCLTLIAWLPLAVGALYLRSGEILLVLLAPYFALCFVFAGMGAHLVRRLTGSPTATALFGAILVAGFCLVLFPVS